MKVNLFISYSISIYQEFLFTKSSGKNEEGKNPLRGTKAHLDMKCDQKVATPHHAQTLSQKPCFF